MGKFYTGTGDDGFTGLLGPGRIPKNHPRTEVVGAVDESSAALGVARAAGLSEQSRKLILTVQRDLYHIMAEVAATPENSERFQKITPERVLWLEQNIDALSQTVQLPNEFIVPGDSPSGAVFAVARTVVRRAERRLADLWHSGELKNESLLPYLNRLSSLCFVLELLENQLAGTSSPTLAKE
jgi:cob(I)alamin adenosyltransferase